MKKVRLMNRPEDYKAIGIKPHIVEPWEDGIRDSIRSGSYEWWYFDAIMDDDTKVVVHFNTKELQNIKDKAAHPSVNIKITTPEGKTYNEKVEVLPEEASFSKEGCNVQIGKDSFVGNLQEYFIKVHPINGVGAELKLTSLSKPWRPETGYFVFGDKEEQYFTWLCVVPKGKVRGALTIDGKTYDVQGSGYHDHQWSNISPLKAWNTWLWARLNLKDYSMLVFDFITTEEYGFKRFPIAFIQDKNGDLVFENTEDVQYEVFDEYLQEGTNKYYPKHSKYTFMNMNKKVECTLKVKDELEIKDPYSSAPLLKKVIMKLLGLRPSYARYFAQGDVVIAGSENTIERSTDLIYEFVYLGKSYKETSL